MGRATLIRRLEDWDSDAALYELAPSLGGHQYVVVSAVVAPFTGPETYIFPADESGEAINMTEMTGSFRGGLSHQEALQRAGYIIT